MPDFVGHDDFFDLVVEQQRQDLAGFRVFEKRHQNRVADFQVEVFDGDDAQVIFGPA